MFPIPRTGLSLVSVTILVAIFAAATPFLLALGWQWWRILAVSACVVLGFWGFEWGWGIVFLRIIKEKMHSRGKHRTIGRVLMADWDNLVYQGKGWRGLVYARDESQGAVFLFVTTQQDVSLNTGEDVPVSWTGKNPQTCYVLPNHLRLMRARARGDLTPEQLQRMPWLPAPPVDFDAEQKPEPVPGSASEPEPGMAQVLAVAPEALPKSEAHVEPEAQPEPEAQAGPEVSPEPDPQSEPEPDTGPDPESSAVSTAESESMTAPATEPEPEPVPAADLRERAQAAYDSGDHDLAVTLMEQGAAAGDVRLMVARGRVAERDKQLDTALSWYRRGAEAGASDGWWSGYRLLRNRSPFTPRREVLARAWLAPLMEKGEPAAFLFRGHLECEILRPHAGEPLLRRAAASGNQDAMALLADRAQDQGKTWEAYHWAAQAAEAGHEESRKRVDQLEQIPRQDAVAKWTLDFFRVEAALCDGAPAPAHVSALTGLSAHARARIAARPNTWAASLDRALYALAALPDSGWNTRVAEELHAGLEARKAQALRPNGTLDDIESLEILLCELADAHEEHGRVAECLACGETLMELAPAKGRNRGAPTVQLLRVSRMRFALGRFDEALAAAEEAEAGAAGTTAETQGFIGRFHLDEAYAVKAQALLGCRRADEALELIQRAVPLRRKAVEQTRPNDPALLGPMLVTQARILAVLGDLDAARRSAQEALDAIERGNTIRPPQAAVSTDEAREVLASLDG
ncbi:hypothetical protein [Leucobacter tenebrionis]|uniref:hypothetical protein n=1 Tax=Leucobacter tenebrionis TaxID=2873270 RepID=UPI001CA60EEC|nr:hypothetical protein [Leucobacter tenebrionis]QZY52062.1 hypothetical protein KVY00_00825 [Leucobacter tenebrionis]